MDAAEEMEPGAAAGQGVGGLFDRLADTYDEVGVPWFGPIAQGLVTALDPRPGERALDVGCGKGAALLPLARAVGPGGDVVGIDVSPRMVEAASLAVRRAGLTNTDVHVADATAPGLEAVGFDVIASSLMLFFLPDPRAAVATWRQLLRRGGRLGIATFGEEAAIWSRIDDLFTPYLPPQLLDARTSGARGPFASDAAMERLVLDAGLADVRTVTAQVDAVLRDADHWYDFSWSVGQRAMWECVPESEREALRRNAAALLLDARDEDGRIRLGQQVRYTLGVAG
jgi:ubiquinone/menaquinone biosynthesis C-methylase UbiE